VGRGGNGEDGEEGRGSCEGRHRGRVGGKEGGEQGVGIGREIGEEMMRLGREDTVGCGTRLMASTEGKPGLINSKQKKRKL